MPSRELHVTINKPFGNLHRPQTVLIVGIDDDRKVLLAGKPSYYPEGISRLPGGGIRIGELPIEAAAREAGEELRYDFDLKDFNPLARVFVSAVDKLGSRYLHTVWMYGLYLDSLDIMPGDDAKEFTRASALEVLNLSNRFMSLPEHKWRVGDGESYSWMDYGKVYGPLHEMAVNEVRKIGMI